MRWHSRWPASKRSGSASLRDDGRLTPICGSTVAVPVGSGLGDVFFNSTGNRLVGTLTGTSEIDSFVVLPSGCLFAAPGSPFTGQGLGQLGAEFRPTNPSQLFVSNAHNSAGLGTVSAYRDGFLGQLTSIGSSPYADFQTAPCWVEISHDGRYLFTVNTGSGNISSYSINPDGSLVLIGSFTITGGGADIDARLSPDGKYLLVDGAGHNFVSVFAVSGGNLTELPSSPTPLPAGASFIRDREHLGRAVPATGQRSRVPRQQGGPGNAHVLNGLASRSRCPGSADRQADRAACASGLPAPRPLRPGSGQAGSVAPALRQDPLRTGDGSSAAGQAPDIRLPCPV